MLKLFTPFVLLFTTLVMSQTDPRIYDIIDDVSAERIKKDISTLVDFGTRHTLSDTLSNNRGIGAARRWIKNEFSTISKGCNDCLEVSYQRNFVEKGTN
ncbi:MAG: peptidase M28, partial [Arenibacter sp.]|nr:peptidase M28 [Arenibacter sp.]